MVIKMRSLGISAISIALTSAVVGNAYYQKKQFYPSVVYITKSNPSMTVSRHRPLAISPFKLRYAHKCIHLSLCRIGHLRAIAGLCADVGKIDEKSMRPNCIFMAIVQLIFQLNLNRFSSVLYGLPNSSI